MERAVIKELQRLGGKYWEKNGYHRVYFDPLDLLSILGYHIDPNNNTAQFQGIPVKLNDVLDYLAGLNGDKFYFSLDSYKFETKSGFMPQIARDARTRLHQLVLAHMR